jgi:hypothetical protein
MNIPAARGCTRPRHYSWIIAPQWWLKGPGSGCLSPFQWSTLEGLQAHVIPLGLLPLLCLNFSMPARLHAPRAGTRKIPNIPCSWIITLGTQSLSLEGGWHTSKKIHEQRSEICNDPLEPEKTIILAPIFSIKYILVQEGAIYYVGVLRVQTVHSTTYIESHTG